jgi:hypothetical protein
MNTKEVFLKDPLTWKLINEGVSSNNTDDLDTLRFELESFVCEGEYFNGMRLILQAYRDSFGGPEQKAAWIRVLWEWQVPPGQGASLSLDGFSFSEWSNSTLACPSSRGSVRSPH